MFSFELSLSPFLTFALKYLHSFAAELQDEVRRESDIIVLLSV